MAQTEYSLAQIIKDVLELTVHLSLNGFLWPMLNSYRLNNGPEMLKSAMGFILANVRRQFAFKYLKEIVECFWTPKKLTICDRLFLVVRRVYGVRLQEWELSTKWIAHIGHIPCFALVKGKIWTIVAMWGLENPATKITLQCIVRSRNVLTHFGPELACVPASPHKNLGKSQLQTLHRVCDDETSPLQRLEAKLVGMPVLAFLQS